jgi:Tfp pilus assembly protein PilV
MAFDLRRFSIIEVTAIAIIVLSVAVIAFVGFSIWAEP